MKNFNKAMINPSSVFKSPKVVLDRRDLSRKEKIEILRRWEYDARTLQVAEDENMGCSIPDNLDEICRALHELGAGSDNEHSAPTKHGGS